ncbi:hypothetical protein HFN60_30450 [Rhizobium leguminosarum]|uniref:hypothetical protein n=1 Tax=Rhizobium leguminosarum TaxID=384 RepID=UPI001C9485A1|nr:hypothetical protein [Rhizobium leguminosarum]MBY5819915.1 hypothetical protein [Rhizobium leguminosarum]
MLWDTRKTDALMLGMIALYLCIEVPFSGYLMHLIAAGATQDQISVVEKFGRILTGVAIFLAFVGGSLIPYCRFEFPKVSEAVGVAVLGALLTIGGTYATLWAIGQYSPLLVSEKTLKQSYDSVILQNELRERGLGDLRPDLSSASWNAFIATAPVIANGERALGMIDGADQLKEREAKRQLGSIEEFRNRFFDQLSPEIERSYSSYRQASDAYLSAVGRIDRDASEEWNKYVGELRRRYPEGVPTVGYTAAGIRNKVRAQIPVSENWHVLDRSSFIAAYRKKARQEIASRSTGMDLPAGLSKAEFWQTAKVQEEIGRQIGHDYGFEPTGVIHPYMSPKQFATRVYVPAYAHVLEGIRSEKSRDQLEEAHRIATLPAMALLLSLAGAALHVFKGSGYAASLIGLKRYRHYVAGAVLLIGIALMSVKGDTITEASVYQDSKAGGVYAQIVEQAIRIQPAFDTFAEMFRSTGIWNQIEGVIATL